MKSRSNRLQTSDPPDDWVDGSWTVDCICGVNFDDGEEMVNCDECGVWVHTRCFRFAKGEKSFACDKCKNDSNNNHINNSEETEVAQLLVELPTKTMKMSSTKSKCFTTSNNLYNYCSPPPPPPPPRRPVYPLWATRPMEEKVHVQGVPGGDDDSSLFQDFPIAFASQLWKSAGYVPKKFNFTYKDFPCLDDGVKVEVEAKEDDKEAGVLYSLSKENVVASLKGGQGRVGGGGFDKKGSKERKLSNGDNKKSSLSGFSRKEKGLSRSIVLKRSRDRLGGKDGSEKKSIKSVNREHGSKKDKGIGCKTVVHSTSGRQAEVCEDKTHKVDGGNSEIRSGLVCSSEKRVMTEKLGHDSIDSSQKSVKKEEAFLNVMGKNLEVLLEGHTNDLSKLKALVVNVDIAAAESNETEVSKVAETAGNCADKSKSGANVDNLKGVMKSYPSDIDVKLESDGLKHCTEQESVTHRKFEGSNMNEAVVFSSPKNQDSIKTFEAVSGSQHVRNEELIENQSTKKLKSEGAENSIELHRTLSGSKEVTRGSVETSKFCGESLPPLASHHKMVSVGKSSSGTSTMAISRSSLAEKNKADSQCPSPLGKRVLSSACSKKESGHVNQVKNEEKHEKTKSTSKDHSKVSSNTISRASQSGKTVTSPGHKHNTSQIKDSLRHPSSKKSSVDNSGVDENQNTSTGENKNTAAAAGGQHRGDKSLQQNLQSSSKSTQSSLGHPPPSSSAPAGLSDKKLALMLHKELNRSPRAPRASRIHHAGSLPQSASAMSILVKRSTSSGGREQQTFSRRKNKDESRSSREQDSEVKKIDRAPSSPDSVKTSDTFTPADGQSELMHSSRKNTEEISTSAHSGPSSTDAKERKSSPAEVDTGTNKGLAPPIHRTLPGLLAEIMGDGRRMTYEELCNAVLPHWQNLRKHNGERYAYSSHSQAVLDCLRNRSEWARLVDRGPKTNASRKKRKIDVEPSHESEDGEDRPRRDRKSKRFESSKKEYPKGRRNVRKRRRLALRGRGVRDDCNRMKVEAASDEFVSSSNSSEDSGSTEDDSHGSGMCAARSEVSGSSAEMVAAT
ncbi:unnamed protein product [Amaranthus hypochondriacus]